MTVRNMVSFGTLTLLLLIAWKAPARTQYIWFSILERLKQLYYKLFKEDLLDYNEKCQAGCFG